MTFFTNNKKINRILLASYMMHILLMIVIIWDTWVSISDRFWIPLALQVLPLLMLLPGLLQHYYRSYSWLCFLCLIYFTSYVIQVYSSNQQWHDWIGLGASVILFVLAMYASRWLQRYFIEQENQTSL